MNKLVSELTVEELKQIIDEAIATKLEDKELDGEEVKEDVVRQLLEQQKSYSHGNRGQDFFEICNELGID